MNAIAVQNLGKKFKLFTSPGGRFLEYMSVGKVKRHEDFWALKDISFAIPSRYYLRNSRTEWFWKKHTSEHLGRCIVSERGIF